MSETPKLVFSKGRVALHKKDGTQEIRGTGTVVNEDEIRQLLRDLEPLEVDDATGSEQGD